MGPRSRFGSLVLAVVAPLTIAGSLATGREAPAPVAVPAAVRDLWIPPGTYTGIVIVSSATTRRWVVSLSSNEKNFPVAIAPAASVIIPFERGWEVHPNDNARITIDGVQTTVPTSTTLLADETTMAISAWGISPTGPIQFVVR
jgi:hypothetical protein